MSPTALSVPSVHRGGDNHSSIGQHFHRSTFLSSLANRSLCFVGPANTSCAMQHDLCATCNVVFITNNMVTLLNSTPCYALVLVINRFYGHRLAERPTLAAKASAVLCTYGPTCQGLHSRGVHNRTLAMAAPAVRTGVANSLAYVLKAVCDVNGWSGCAHFTRMHITGVTFYDRGPEYTSGYKLLNESSRHDTEANKAYVLAWVRSLGRRASIDYPQCLNAAADSDTQMVAMDAERGTVVVRRRTRRSDVE